MWKHGGIYSRASGRSRQRQLGYSSIGVIISLAELGPFSVRLRLWRQLSGSRKSHRRRVRARSYWHTWKRPTRTRTPSCCALLLTAFSPGDICSNTLKTFFFSFFWNGWLYSLKNFSASNLSVSVISRVSSVYCGGRRPAGASRRRRLCACSAVLPRAGCRAAPGAPGRSCPRST